MPGFLALAVEEPPMIKEVKLNGKKHAGYRISHEELVHAGKIEFILK